MSAFRTGGLSQAAASARGARIKEGCSGQIALSGVIPTDALENQDEAARWSRPLFKLRFSSQDCME